MPYNERRPYNVLLDFRHGLQHQVLISEHDLFMHNAVSKYGEYSEAEVDVFRELIPETAFVVDVGANVGLHTLALADIAWNGTVLAFEPQRLIYQTLCANIALNSAPHVDAIRAGLSNKARTIKVPEFSPYADNNTGGLSLDPSLQQGSVTPLLVLDSMQLPALDFVKVDVEGMEPDVLEGAENLIRRFQPYLYCEFYWNRPRLLDTLAAWGFCVFRHRPAHNRTPNYKGVEVDPDDRIHSEMILACAPSRVPGQQFLEAHGFEELTTVAQAAASTTKGEHICP